MIHCPAGELSIESKKICQMDNIDYLKEDAPENDQKDVAMLGEWLERKGAA